MMKGNRKGGHRWLQWIALPVLCAALALCYYYGERIESRRVPAEPTVPLSEEEAALDFPRLAVTRADHETEADAAAEINLSERSGECVITDGGAYRLSGRLSGCLKIDAQEQTVHLVLDGAAVESGDGPALWVQSAGKVILTLAEGTENSFSDSGDYRDYPDTEACVFSEADLTINGSGKLTVNGFYKDAVRSQNVVRILGGEINIKCKRTGIHGTDGIHVTGGKISISSEKNGFGTTKSGKDGRGNAIISGGEHSVIAGRHAFLVGRGDLYIYNCTVKDRSVVSTYNVGGQIRVQDGCVQ